MDEIKKFQKKSFQIVGTGIGLGALAGVSEDKYTSEAIGKLGKGLSPISSLSVMETQMNIMNKFIKKKK